MADKTFSGGIPFAPETARDMGDGTYARVVALAASDRSAIAGVYRRSTAVGATPGDGLLISGVTTAGAVTITLAGGGSISVNVPVGSTVLPFSATAVNVGTTGGTASSLFFT